MIRCRAAFLRKCRRGKRRAVAESRGSCHAMYGPRGPRTRLSGHRYPNACVAGREGLSAPLAAGDFATVRRYPIVAARLVEPPAGETGQLFWQFRPGASCPLREACLLSDAPAAVLEHVGQLCSNAPNPVEADPIEFHLLHRPGGRDVLVLQYNHVVMDNRMAVPLLRELDRYGDADDQDNVVDGGMMSPGT